MVIFNNSTTKHIIAFNAFTAEYEGMTTLPNGLNEELRQN